MGNLICAETSRDSSKSKPTWYANDWLKPSLPKKSWKKYVHSKNINELYCDQEDSTPILYAVRRVKDPQHRVEVVEYLISCGADVTIVTSNGDSPLHWGCDGINHESCDAVFEMLISASSGVEAFNVIRTTDGRTPLVCAAANGCFYGTQRLFRAGSDATLGGLGMTARDHARYRGHTDCFKYLDSVSLEENKNTPMWIDTYLWGAPLHSDKYLWDEKKRDWERALPNFKTSANEVFTDNGEHYTPLFIIAQYGCSVALRTLMKKYVVDYTRLDAKGRTVLHAVMSMSDSESFRFHYLLEKVPPAVLNAYDPTTGKTPLHVVAENGSLEFVEALVNAGADWTLKSRVIDGSGGKTARDLAFDSENKGNTHVEIVKFLDKLAFETVNDKFLSKYSSPGAFEEVDEKGFTCLHLVALNSELCGCASKLVEEGANLMALDEDGRTPQNIAAEKENEVLLEYLESQGRAKYPWYFETQSFTTYECYIDESNVNEKYYEGKYEYTPLFMAAYWSGADVVQYCISKGGDVNYVNLNSETALIRACTMGKQENVRVLLEAGAHCTVNVEGCLMGRPALHKAITQKSFACVKLLVEAGADMRLRDFTGKSVGDMAVDSGVKQIVDLIQNTQNPRPCLYTIQDDEFFNEERKDSYVPQWFCKSLWTSGVHAKMQLAVPEEKREESYIVSGCAEYRPLLFVSERGSSASLVYVIEEMGLDPMLMNRDGHTAFHFACAAGREKNVKVLLQTTASTLVEAEDKRGRSALHISCEKNMVACAKELLSYGVSPTKASMKRWPGSPLSPQDIAEKKELEELLDLMPKKEDTSSKKRLSSRLSGNFRKVKNVMIVKNA